MKVFNDVEYKWTVTGYDHKRKIYHILYEDGDTKDFYHNEVRVLCVGTIKWYPKKKQWKQKMKAAVTDFIQKFSCTTKDMYEHIMSLLVEDVRATASLRHNDVDLSEVVIESEMIKVFIDTLASQYITPSEQVLGYFTRRN